ncbi:glucosyltransferase domain-containing protein [Proteus terrae]|uniref:glucosyltransferase domain-containing protein n=1 Tax=Proteus terrae TaxID=1574161 RepID=UPI00288A8C48|nr:glucosyltransferase domain-containing protein [Proteus terrae]
MNINLLMKNKFILLLCVIYILPIILANVYYIDDMGRAASGYGWDDDGRIFATLIMQAISFNQIIASIYPLSLIISAFIILLSGYIVSQVLIQKNNSFYNISSLILLTSPFYLENLSYRYDSIPMSLSVLLSVIPFLYKSKLKFFISSLFCLTIVFGLYQTSSMIYFAVLVCILIGSIKEKKILKNYKIIIISLFCFLSSYIIYKNILSFYEINLNRGQLIKLDEHFLGLILDRLDSYYLIYKSLLDSNYVIAISPLIISLFLSVVLYIKSGGISSIVSNILFLFLLSLLFILTMLPNLVIINPWYSPRTMVCFPFIIYGIILYCNNINKIFLNISISILIFFSFILSNSYGNILKSNDEYNSFLSQSISSTIMENNHYSSYNLVIVGRQKTPHRSNLQYEIYPILKRVTPVYMTEGWYWGVASLSNYLNINSVSNRSEISKKTCDYNLIKETSLYSIYSEDDLFIVDFSNKCR